MQRPAPVPTVQLPFDFITERSNITCGRCKLLFPQPAPQVLLVKFDPKNPGVNAIVKHHLFIVKLSFSSSSFPSRTRHALPFPASLCKCCSLFRCYFPFLVRHFVWARKKTVTDWVWLRIQRGLFVPANKKTRKKLFGTKSPRGFSVKLNSWLFLPFFSSFLKKMYVGFF